MSPYLTRDKLAHLLGCAPHSYATMAKRLRGALRLIDEAMGETK